MVSYLLEIVGNGIVENRELDSPEIWLETYLPEGKESDDLFTQIANHPICNQLPSYVNSVKNENWEAIWQKQHPPQSIANRVFIYRPWDYVEPSKNDVSLIIEPGMAFGTGRHETTQLCIQGLLDHVKPGMSVLDLGCGTGILAFVAAKLGASCVLAMDNDPDAVHLAIHNREVNRLADKVEIIHGSLASLTWSSRKFDIIVANIVSQVLIQLLEAKLVAHLRPNHKLLLCGILNSELNDFSNLLLSYGLKLINTKSSGEWSYIEAATADG